MVGDMKTNTGNKGAAVTFTRESEEAVAVLVDGVEVGWLERIQHFTDVGVVQASSRVSGTTWTYNANEGRDMENLGTLGTAKRIVREHLEAEVAS